MKYVPASALLIVGAMSYGAFGAVGQSAQSGLWQLIVSSSPPFAWKINAQTGETYFCATSANFTCTRLQDR